MKRFTSPIAAAVVLVLFGLLLIASSWNESATIDEPGSPAAGLTHWKLNDYRLDPENGNLLHRLSALPLLGTQLPDLTKRSWLNPEPWDFGSEWLNRPGNDVQGLLRQGRAVMALVAVALAALVWFCSRSLFGPVGGMISLLLCVLSPTILANGPLMTADTLAALFFLLATVSWWRLLHRVDARRMVISILATGGLLVAKMSGTLFLPITLILVVVRLSADRRQFSPILAACVIQAVAAYAILWGSYGFRYSMMAPDQPSTGGSAYAWEPLLSPPSLPELIEDQRLPAGVLAKARATVDRYSVPLDGWTGVSDTALVELRRDVLTPAQSASLDAAHAAGFVPSGVVRLITYSAAHKLLPEAYLMGALHAIRTTRMRAAFLNGENYYIGKWWFFPYTFALKTPLPFIGLLGLAIAAIWVSRPRLYDYIPFAVLFICYALSAVNSGINIGHRHILTLYPPLFILCGAAGAWFTSQAVGQLGSRAVMCLLGLNAVETAWRFPHYIAYFNGIVSPDSAYRHVVDSSLDWGQDLPGVGKYIDDHRADGPFYLSYFGAGVPKAYGIEADLLPSFPDNIRTDSRPVVLVPIRSATPSPADIEEVQRKYPSHNPVAGGTDEKGNPLAILVRRPDAWKLKAGTCIISATQLQSNSWHEFEEVNYQKMRQLTRPLVAPVSSEEFLRALGERSVAETAAILVDFEQARMFRLAAFLRSRNPDSNIGYSILVYRMTDADVALALEGPPPYRAVDDPGNRRLNMPR